MSTLRQLLVLSVALLCLGARAAEPKPTLGMGVPSYDNGRFFRDLFEHPDQWQETRAKVDTLIYADHNIVQSWIEAPSKCVPETEPWSFTRSVLDFSKKFVKKSP